MENNEMKFKENISILAHKLEEERRVMEEKFAKISAVIVGKRQKHG